VGAGAGDDDDDTGSAEEDTVLMQNNGTPGATSFDSAASKFPKYAFENTVTYTGQTSGDNYWESEESPNIRGMPQYVWMKFATPHRIAKLGFSSQSNMFAPRRFDIVDHQTAPRATATHGWFFSTSPSLVFPPMISREE